MANKPKKNTRTSSGAKVSSQVKNYGNDPFVVKKVEESKAFLEKYGFPEELT